MEQSHSFYEDLVLDEIISHYGGITHAPNLQYFVKKYAKSLEGNDPKAVSVFRHYETLERVRSFQFELLNIKKGAISRAYLRKLLGPKRADHMGSYEEWAAKMLILLSSASTKL